VRAGLLPQVRARSALGAAVTPKEMNERARALGWQPPLEKSDFAVWCLQLLLGGVKADGIRGVRTFEALCDMIQIKTPVLLSRHLAHTMLIVAFMMDAATELQRALRAKDDRLIGWHYGGFRRWVEALDEQTLLPLQRAAVQHRISDAVGTISATKRLLDQEPERG
jgi:hypothetical protein